VAIPTYFGSGVLNGADTDAYGPVAFPADTQAGDIAILVTASEGHTEALSDAQGFAELGSQANKTYGVAGNNGSICVGVYWKRLAGGDTGPSVAAVASRAHVGVIHVVRGCIATGDPWNVWAEGVSSSSSASISIVGAETTVADCLVMAIVGHSRDVGGAAVSAWANTDLANLAERQDESTNVSYGVGLAMATGEKAAAGTYAATTATLVGASSWGTTSIALRPAAAAAAATRSFAVVIA